MQLKPRMTLMAAAVATLLTSRLPACRDARLLLSIVKLLTNAVACVVVVFCRIAPLAGIK